MSLDNGEHYIRAAEAKLWTSASGHGVPAIMFNGGPGCDDYLAPVARLIDHRCRVIRFEPRGCGRSDWDGRYDLATLLADTEHIRQAYGVERWLLLGHSHGPNLALAYALQHPERTIGIVGIAGGKVVNDRSWSEIYHARKDDPGEETGGIVFRADNTVNAQGNAEWRSYCQRPTLLRDLAHLPTPTVFINAAEDIRPNWPTEQLAQLIPNGKYVVIAGAGHMIWLTHTQELSGELQHALDYILGMT